MYGEAMSILAILAIFYLLGLGWLFWCFEHAPEGEEVPFVGFVRK